MGTEGRTQGIPRPEGHEHGVHHAADLLPSQLKQVLIFEFALYPLCAPVVDVLLQAVVHVRRQGGDDERARAGGDGLGAAGGGEGVRADDEVRRAGAVEGGEKRGGLHFGGHLRVSRWWL